MIKRTGFTKIDLIVTLACAVFVFANAQIISAGGREKAKKDICLTNLRFLTAAWQVYAEDNSGKIVNAAAPATGGVCPGCPPSSNYAAKSPTSPTDFHYNELPWVGIAYQTSFGGGYTPAPECQQRCAIQTGALWKYVKDYEAYSCPTGIKGEMLAYSILDSMNGKYKWNGCSGSGDTPKELCLKNLNQVIKPEKKMVFFEEGKASPDSYAVYSGCERWFDPPAVRHDDGTNVSFADGHSAYWKWKSPQTIQLTKDGQYNFTPTTISAKQDLYKIQIACWGKLCYYPTVAPDPNW
jgi:prepilin-type processing-associated H-X9-DG protein